MSDRGSWRRYVQRHGFGEAARAFVERFLYQSRRCVITYSPAAGPPAIDREFKTLNWLLFLDTAELEETIYCSFFR